MTDIPQEVIDEYNLKTKVIEDGHVYIKIQKGMYGIPQSRLIAQQLLKKRLNAHGYQQSGLVDGLWTHEWRPI